MFSEISQCSLEGLNLTFIVHHAQSCLISSLLPTDQMWFATADGHCVKKHICITKRGIEDKT